jgi:hypothetical protein
MYLRCVVCGKMDITDVCGECRKWLDNPPEEDPYKKVSRCEALLRICIHPYYGPQVAKVGLKVLREFIENNDGLDHNQFERAAQKLFLDKAEKPRFWSTIEDILVAVNNMAASK